MTEKMSAAFCGTAKVGLVPGAGGSALGTLFGDVTVTEVADVLPSAVMSDAADMDSEVDVVILRGALGTGIGGPALA